MGRGNHPVVRDVSGDQWVSPVRIGGSSGKSGTGWGTLGEVRKGSGYPRGGPERVVGPTRRSGTGRETLG